MNRAKASARSWRGGLSELRFRAGLRGVLRAWGAEVGKGPRGVGFSMAAGRSRGRIDRQAGDTGSAGLPQGSPRRSLAMRQFLAITGKTCYRWCYWKIRPARRSPGNGRNWRCCLRGPRPQPGTRVRTAADFFIFFPYNSLKSLDSEKEMKGNEKKFPFISFHGLSFSFTEFT